ncbi:hypothetical protein EYF80_046035 [Liparis tanakae]|uniref:Uncharacterized protein n=1 Tax=Liparis tanakae TaxID=230148 RepID=A0A4Z2FSS3_9TELE|nr:hypothetical protein EYF80_046035 [Liparis tanakae]
MDCTVCSGYVTTVATALATAPMMKTSADDSLEGERRRKRAFINHELDGRVQHQQQRREGPVPQGPRALIADDLRKCICQRKSAITGKTGTTTWNDFGWDLKVNEKPALQQRLHGGRQSPQRAPREPLGVRRGEEGVSGGDEQGLGLQGDVEEVRVQHHAVGGVVRSRAVGEVSNDGVAYGAAVDP